MAKKCTIDKKITTCWDCKYNKFDVCNLTGELLPTKLTYAGTSCGIPESCPLEEYKENGEWYLV